MRYLASRLNSHKVDVLFRSLVSFSSRWPLATWGTRTVIKAFTFKSGGGAASVCTPEESSRATAVVCPHHLHPGESLGKGGGNKGVSRGRDFWARTERLSPNQTYAATEPLTASIYRITKLYLKSTGMCGDIPRKVRKGLITGIRTLAWTVHGENTQRVRVCGAARVPPCPARFYGKILLRQTMQARLGSCLPTCWADLRTVSCDHFYVLR